jgi:uncharacterized membrane protein
MVARVRSSVSDRRCAVIGAVALLTAFVVAMLVARMIYTGSAAHGSLVWDLFLAWVPFALSLMIYERARHGSSTSLLVSLACLWLVFFPNAPYLVTELKFVGAGTRVPILYDALLFGAAGWTGLLLGLTSLFLIHGVARRLLGTAKAWALVVVVLAASSFGIYLGRVLRWNSWDVVSHPQWMAGLLQDVVLHPLSHPRPLALTVLLTSFLLVSYLVLYSLARLTPEWDALERPLR